MKTGIELIAAERQRQIEVEGWTPEHDDEHTDGELSEAAVCYAKRNGDAAFRGFSPPFGWPWDRKWWKPKSQFAHANDPARIADLVKAGALIAAEIDRLQRLTPPATSAAAGDEGA